MHVTFVSFWFRGQIAISTAHALTKKQQGALCRGSGAMRPALSYGVGYVLVKI